jgi:hypothetical protein
MVFACRSGIRGMALNNVTAGNLLKRKLPFLFYFYGMKRTIIFIPKGAIEPVSVVVNHKPALNEGEHAGIWNIDTNEVFLNTDLWNQFSVNDQEQQGRVFGKLLRVSGSLLG